MPSNGLDLSQSHIGVAHFRGADLSGSTLAGVNTDGYRSLDFQNADLSGADLDGLKLVQANFHDANLRQANLSGCQLEQADFTGADLQGADLENARVVGAVFRDVQGLSHAETRRLKREAGPWRFLLTTGMVAFLDSIAFPVCLLLAIPLVAVVTRAARRRRKRLPPDAPTRLQINLSSMLLLTAVIGGFLGVALLSPTGAYSLALVCAFYMMVAGIVRRRVSQKFSVGLLVTALVYVPLNLAVYFAAASFVGPFDIFEMAFKVGVVFVGPALAIGGAIVAATIGWRSQTHLSALSLVGFVIWIAGVGYAGKGKIVRFVTPPVTPGCDVLDLKELLEKSLRDSAVFAPVSGSVPD